MYINRIKFIDIQSATLSTLEYFDNYLMNIRSITHQRVLILMSFLIAQNSNQCPACKEYQNKQQSPLEI